MNYPQYQPHPGYQPYPVPPKPPGGGTAIAAGVLASLGALWHLFGLVAGVITFFEDEVAWFQVVAMVLNGIAGGALLAGAVLLFLRRAPGRWLVVAGVAAALCVSVLVVIASGSRLAFNAPEGVLGAALVLVAAAIPPAATLLLVLLPSTVRWLEAAPPRD